VASLSPSRRCQIPGPGELSLNLHYRQIDVRDNEGLKKKIVGTGGVDEWSNSGSKHTTFHLDQEHQQRKIMNGLTSSSAFVVTTFSTGVAITYSKFGHDHRAMDGMALRAPRDIIPISGQPCSHAVVLV
jgi:hypothetical protein